MLKAKKRRTDHACNLEELQIHPSVCILHVSGIQHGEFIPLQNIRGPPQEKLEMLHNVRKKRLLQSHGSPARVEAVCKLIPDNLDGVDLEMTGYHRGCYQAFTKHQDRLKCVAPDNEPSTIRSPRKSSTSSRNIFPPECIFCGKLETKVSGRTERCVQFASFKGKEAAWTRIESQALEIGDNRLHRKVAGEDLFAREARFHKSCHSSFKLRYVNYLRDQANRSTENKQDEKQEAHQSSLNVVVDFIREVVIGQKEVVQLGTLRHLYVQELERCGFPNPDFRSDKLKTRLQRHEINECIAFTKVFPGDRGCITYNLVYSTSISVAEAVTYAYRLGSRDKFENVVLHCAVLFRVSLKS